MKLDLQTKYRRAKIFNKFFRISPQELAELINQAEERAGSPRRTNRQTVDQIINGRMKTPWIRAGLAVVLGENVRDLWPDGYKKPRKAA